jgi:mannose-6-phosphate isomerase-like protein (cupin superfamily)
MRHTLNRRTAGTAALVALVALVLAGCESPREKLPSLSPRLKLDPSALAGHPLKEGAAYQLLTLQDTGRSSLHVFRLKVGGELPARWHEKSDLTILSMEGGAIVEIEQDRYAMKPGQAVMVPALRQYRILHHGSDKDFVAAFVFAPAYDPADRVDPEIKGHKPRTVGKPTGLEQPYTKPVR